MAEMTTALIGSIQKYSTEDGPGIRTTVFLKGCPLRCQWCHNPELIDPRQQIILRPSNCIGCGACVEACPRHCLRIENGKAEVDWKTCDHCLLCTKVCYAQAVSPVATPMTAEEVIKVVKQDRSFYKNTGGGMTVSGGEVLMQPRFAEELISAAKAEKIDVCIDTCGYGNYSDLETLASYDNVTAILYDMKMIDDCLHRQYTGVSNDLILDNLARMAADPELNKKLWMRMPLIKDVNDTQDVIEKTSEFYLSHNIRKVTLIGYHEMGISKMRNIGGDPVAFETPEDSRIAEIQRFFEKNGIVTEALGQRPE